MRLGTRLACRNKHLLSSNCSGEKRHLTRLVVHAPDSLSQGHLILNVIGIGAHTSCLILLYSNHIHISFHSYSRRCRKSLPTRGSLPGSQATGPPPTTSPSRGGELLCFGSAGSWRHLPPSGYPLLQTPGHSPTHLRP